MASKTGALYATNKIPATNALLEVRTVEFKPRKVVVTNLTSLARLEWNDAMDDDSGFKTVAAGTRTLVSAAAITPLDGPNPGFSVGALADVNDDATETLLWECWS